MIGILPSKQCCHYGMEISNSIADTLVSTPDKLIEIFSDYENKNIDFGTFPSNSIVGVSINKIVNELKHIKSLSKIKTILKNDLTNLLVIMKGLPNIDFSLVNENTFGEEIIEKLKPHFDKIGFIYGNSNNMISIFLPFLMIKCLPFYEEKYKKFSKNSLIEEIYNDIYVYFDCLGKN